MSWRSARVLALGLLLCVVVARFVMIPGSSAKADGDDLSPAIVGTWIVHVVPPAGSGVAPYDSLSTHSAGGTLVVSPDPSFGPVLRTSTGHGAWRRTGDANTFSTTHWGIAYNPGGEVVFTFKIDSSIVTQGQTFEGQGQLLICDTEFANCSSAVPPGQFAQLTGKRVRVTPIE
jgi:hypothetical protein